MSLLLLLAFLRLPSGKAQCFLLEIIRVSDILSHFSSPLEDLNTLHLFFFLSFLLYRMNSMRLGFNGAVCGGSTMQFISTNHTSRCSVMGLKEAMRHDLLYLFNALHVFGRNGYI
jgi:hypothetical protein